MSLFRDHLNRVLKTAPDRVSAIEVAGLTIPVRHFPEGKRDITREVWGVYGNVQGDNGQKRGLVRSRA